MEGNALFKSELSFPGKGGNAKKKPAASKAARPVMRAPDKAHVAMIDRPNVCLQPQNFPSANTSCLHPLAICRKLCFWVPSNMTQGLYIWSGLARSLWRNYA